MGTIPKHSIMQNIFSPTSKVPIDYSSLNNVKSPKFKVSSEIYQSLNCNSQSKSGNQLGKLQTLIFMADVKAVFRSLTPFLSLLTATNFFLLGWFHYLLAAFLSRYPMVLASQTSWGLLQGNFNVTDSCFNV